MKWELDIMGPIKLAWRYIGNKYIFFAIKWVEARTLRTNVVVITWKFMYECILFRFGCPFIIITN
jgi:hypothetical protein